MGNRQLIRIIRTTLVLLGFIVTSCSVYTVDKLHLEDRLKPHSQALCCKGRSLNNLIQMFTKQHNNHVDTLLCLDGIGKVRAKKIRYDSKITIITTDRTIRMYAKTLYIWNDEFLIGERSAPSLRSPNYFPVKLKDIIRIEVRG
jgi:hypothetical protein